MATYPFRNDPSGEWAGARSDAEVHDTGCAPAHKGEGGESCRHRVVLSAWLLMRSKILGAPKAITAATHKLARIVYHLVRFGVAYEQREQSQYADEVKKIEAPVEVT